MILTTSLARTCTTDRMGRAVVLIYANVSGEQNWTSIRLMGSGAGGVNRAAIGARVHVTAGGVTQTREIQHTCGPRGRGH